MKKYTQKSETDYIQDMLWTECSQAETDMGATYIKPAVIMEEVLRQDTLTMQ